MDSILVIQLKRIGDLVVTLPALEALRQAYPTAQLTLLIDVECSGLVPALKLVNQVLIYRKNALNFTIWRKLIFGKFSTVLDFTGTDRSSILAWLSKADRRIAFQWASKSQFRGSTYTDLVESPVRDKHTIDHYLDLLKPLGIKTTASEPRLEIPKSARLQATEMLRRFKVRPPYIVLHPGAARLEKYWNPARWAEIAEHCHFGLHRACVVIGGRSEMEKEAIGEVQRRARSPVIDFSGQLSLMTSAALIEAADLLIGIDSGPSHLGAALGRPQITLFGPTNPFHWRPRHAKALVLQGGKKNPLETFDSRAAPGDLNDLSTEEVIHAINFLLA